VRLRFAFTVDSVPFTTAVIAGTASLGGSESACLGLARALCARGHEVHLFVTKLAEDAPPVDHAGVWWHPLTALDELQITRDFDVLVALRMPQPLTVSAAKLRILWNQDLMVPGQMQHGVMGCAWAFDRVAYVSSYHRQQWEAIVPELAAIGYTTRNGFDPALVPETATKRPNRIIHISRPERGLGPLLAMWPAFKRAHPEAELAYCRYSSMYDAGGWGKICEDYDRQAEAVNADVGGIVALGELGKAALYQAIAESAVMWYPGVVDFGETSCIAAIEAQANWTPFVGSFKGALPETVPSGRLIAGDATTPEYQQASMAAVADLLAGCRRQSVAYRQLQQAGRAHVARYTYAAIAADWEAWLLKTFLSRYETNKLAVLRQLLHDDDHVTATLVAEEIIRTGRGDDQAEAVRAHEFCEHVIAGKDQTSEQYAAHACDPREELALIRRVGAGSRPALVCQTLAGRTRILDVACGSGAYALALAQADPTRRIVAVDYAQGNIDALRSAAEALGLTSQIEAICAPVWDFDTGGPSAWLTAYLAAHAGTFDGLWCGEFIEHVADCTGLVTTLEQFVTPGGAVCYSCPFGPMADLVDRKTALHKGHVHHFRSADVEMVFGRKADFTMQVLPWGPTPRGAMTGNWFIQYTAGAAPTGSRPAERRMLLRPYQRVTGMVLCDQTLDVRRCLDGIWPVVDEILVGDTGLTPVERESLLVEFPRSLRIVPVGPVRTHPDGFAGARNVLLREALGEWAFWIDCDEQLLGGLELRGYLDGPVFHGFAIAQNHLHIDQPMTKDLPIRLFRRLPSIQFYGCVHEQPQMGHANGDIMPSLQINNIHLAHTGYLHEAARRHKAIHRNMELLIRDQERFPDRMIGRLITLREHANLALWARERAEGRLTAEAAQHYRKVITLFEQHFDDPSNRYHDLMRPFYESALRSLEGAMEIEMALGGRVGGLQANTAPASRFWARTPAQVKRMLEWRVAEALKPFQPPALDVTPVVGTPWRTATPVPVEVPA
jgi:2-polyprenyl-3-methyl-5-hydroxy-6-metoxy-1,4-benzoquinol methylase/glycosyltransferase involved in cell wall biosynthesis